jgi:hypothetical protein
LILLIFLAKAGGIRVFKNRGAAAPGREGGMPRNFMSPLALFLKHCLRNSIQKVSGGSRKRPDFQELETHFEEWPASFIE